MENIEENKNQLLTTKENQILTIKEVSKEIKIFLQENTSAILKEYSDPHSDEKLISLKNELNCLLAEALINNDYTTVKAFYFNILRILSQRELEVFMNALLKIEIEAQNKIKLATCFVYLFKNINILKEKITKRKSKTAKNSELNTNISNLLSLVLSITDKFIGFYKQKAEVQRKLSYSIIQMIQYSQKILETCLFDYLKSLSTSNKDGFVNSCIMISSIYYHSILFNKNRKNKFIFNKDILNKIKSEVILPFYEDSIMVDDDLSESIPLQIKFSPCLVVFEHKELSSQEEEKLIAINSIERLFSRNSSNFKFLEVFLSYKRNYTISETMMNGFFNKFEDYFFQNKNNQITGSSIRSFNLFTKNSFESDFTNKTIELLLEKNFIADQSDINFNVSCFMVSLITNQTLSSDIIIKITDYILTNFVSNFKDSQKPKFDELLNLLIKGTRNYQKSRVSSVAILEGFDKIYSNSSFSKFFPKINIILTNLINQNVVNIDKIIESNKNIISHIDRLVDFATENTDSFYILALGSFVLDQISMSTFVSRLTSTIKALENKDFIKQITEDHLTSLLIIYRNTICNDDCISNIEDEYENYRSIVIQLISEFLLKLDLLNKFYHQKELTSLSKCLLENNNLELLNTLLTYFTHLEYNNFDYYRINNYNFRNVLYVKDSNNTFLLSKLTLNQNSKFLILYLIGISNSIKTNKPLRDIFLQKKENKVSPRTFDFKTSSIIDLVLGELNSNKEKLNAFITFMSGFLFSDLGLFNQKNEFLLQSSLSLLQLSKLKSREFTDTILWKNTSKLLNSSKINYLFKTYDFYEKNLNYFSFFDLKSTVETLSQRIEQEGIQYDIEIEDEKDIIEQQPKIAKNKIKEILTLKYKNQVSLVINFSISLFIKKLKVIDQMSRLKILSFGDDLALNEKIFSLLTKISKHKPLYGYCKSIILSLFSSDPGVVALGEEFKKLLKFATSVSLNINEIKTQTNIDNQEKNEYIHNEEDDEEEENEEERYLKKKLKENNKENDINGEEMLKVAQRVFLLLDSKNSEINQQKLSVYFIKYSNNLLEALFLSLESDCNNELKDFGVKLVIKIMDYDLEKITLIKCFEKFNMFLRMNYYNSTLEALIEKFYLTCKKYKVENYFYTLLDNLPHFNYIAKVFIMNLLNKNKSEIKLNNSLINKVFLHMFDSNFNLITECCNFWNNSELRLSNNFPNYDEFNFNYKENIIVEMCSSAVITFFHVYKDFNSQALEKLFNCYEHQVELDIKAIKEYKDKNQEDENEYEDETNYTHGINFEVKRIILLLLMENIGLFNKDDKTKIIKFVIKNGATETNSDLFGIFRSIIDKTIFNLDDTKSCKDILDNIEQTVSSLISLNDSKTKSQEKAKYTALSLNIYIIGEIVKKFHFQKQKENFKVMTTLKNFLLSTNITSLSTSKDKAHIEKLESLISISAVEEVMTKASECLPYCISISSSFEKEIEDNISYIIKSIIDGDQKEINIGYFFILSGYLRFKGISYFLKSKLNVKIEEKCKSNCSEQEKISNLMLLNTLSKTLNKLFEPIFVKIFDFICLMINNREEVVRNCAKEIIKVQIRTLSGFGVKQIMPIMIKDLHTKNWRSKIVNIEILGNFAFCAPKQLSLFLPQVIKELLVAFQDAHPKVMEVSIQVLKDISSVITNPEIVDLSEILINAFFNPFENSQTALTSLLETRFKHAIDPPSLGLIIPIIDYNLKILNDKNKMMTAQLIGAICSLISDPKMIHPYLDIILPNLKDALFDSSPDVRNAIAKAFGGLTKSLGELYKHEIINWVSYYLEHDVEMVQRSGAAQAYAEILIAFGEENIENNLPGLVEKIQQPNKIHKEGYLSIFVFLPSCLGEKFEKYFDHIFPLIIDGFSDDNEKVRNVSNKIFEICIGIFSKKNTRQLVSPLIKCLFDSNWRIRNSSIALIKTLINSLSNEFYKEESEFFAKDIREEILANTFILKADTTGNTATIANIIWRDYVDNIPRYLSSILHIIYDKITFLFSSKNDDTLDIAEGIIQMLVSKFSDKFFMELLPMIEKHINESKDNEVECYSSFLILQIACTHGSSRLLSGFKENFIKIVNDNIFTPHIVIRKIIASIIYELAQKFGDQVITRNFIHNLLRIARELCEKQNLSKDSNTETIENIDSILEVVANYVEVSKGEALHIVLSEIFKKPFFGKFFDLIYLISESIADHLADPVHLKDIYNNLFSALTTVPTESIKAIINISVQIDDQVVPIFIEILQKQLEKINSPLNESDTLVYLMEIVSGYISESSQDLSRTTSILTSFICSFLVFDVDKEENRKTNSQTLIPEENSTKLNKSINRAIKALIEKIEKESIEKVIDIFYEKFKAILDQYNLEDNVINGNTRFDRLNFKLTTILESLLIMIQNGLLHSQEKLSTCSIISLIISNLSKQNLKPYLIKLSGPIIRILSEKGNTEAKEIILDSLIELANKMQGDLKAIIPQFRSVLLKNLLDPTMNNGIDRMIFKCADSVLSILTYDMRSDLVCSEISKAINTKISNGDFVRTMNEVEILIYIIKFHGKSIKAPVIEDLLTQYSKIYTSNIENKNFPFDIYISLISVLLQWYNINNKCSNNDDNIKYLEIESAALDNNIHLSTLQILSSFNKDASSFSSHEVIKQFKINSKENSVIALKLIGKIINKSKFILAKDDQLHKLYDDLFINIVNETGFFNISDNILDANILIFLLSIGYSPVYESDKEILRSVTSYLIELIDEGKINSQLLVNTLSLLSLKKVVLKPEVNEIIGEMNSLMIDPEQIDSIKDFLKKVYYLMK